MENIAEKPGLIQRAPANLSPKSLASMIDHTLLKADSQSSDIKRICDEARKYSFFSVCVGPSFVRLAKDWLDESEVAICTVVGFPHGVASTEVKAFEAAQALRNGADEIDMVIHVGALKSKDFRYVQNDISAVRRQCPHTVLKVIIETSLLDESEKIAATTLVKGAGADFVKTSTGFAGGGATVEDVQLLRQIVGPNFGVKASGGVRDYATARSMVEAGATRIGASASVDIVNNQSAAPPAQGGY